MAPALKGAAAGGKKLSPPQPQGPAAKGKKDSSNEGVVGKTGDKKGIKGGIITVQEDTRYK